MSTQNIKLNKYKIPLISSALGISGVFLFSYLTFIPSQTFAAEEARTLADITKMQEMNKNICDNTKDLETQYQLEDIRDHKIYWVSKLKDGNCWMTQNLDYDGGGTPKDLSNWENKILKAQYYDHGMQVLNGRMDRCYRMDSIY